MAELNDLLVRGDSLLQGDVKINGGLNNNYYDQEDDCKILHIRKKLDMSTIGNKITLFNVPVGYSVMKANGSGSLIEVFISSVITNYVGGIMTFTMNFYNQGSTMKTETTYNVVPGSSSVNGAQSVILPPAGHLADGDVTVECTTEQAGEKCYIWTDIILVKNS